MLKTIIVVPCHNEERRLDPVAILSFAASADAGLRLLFVNDGSRDGTSRVIHELAAKSPYRVSAMDLPSNVGKAEAVRQGMLAAISFNPEAIGFWDADLATPLRIIHEFRTLLASRPNLLWIFGSRVKMLGRRIDRRVQRHLAGRAFATAVSLALALDVYDTQCGAKLFRSDERLSSVLADPFLSRWIFDVELLARLAVIGREGGAPALEDCVYEAPILEWVDVKGSKVKPSDFLAAAGELWRIRKRYRPHSRPRPTAAAV